MSRAAKLGSEQSRETLSTENHKQTNSASRRSQQGSLRGTEVLHLLQSKYVVQIINRFVADNKADRTHKQRCMYCLAADKSGEF